MININIHRIFSLWKEIIGADYNIIHANRVRQYINPKNKKCLIVGCNRGKDCKYFVDFGARKVHGLDIIKDVGSNYKHPRVKYFELSAENMKGIKDNTYDLVYCVATMEHIPRIELALKEMVRVTKPGGIIYSLASPLWNSKDGHHRGDLFSDYPWIHLRLNKRQMIKYCQKKNILWTRKSLDGHQHKKYIDHMFDPICFNQLPAQKYLDVCNELKEIRIIRNDIEKANPESLSDDVLKELQKKDSNEFELLAITHTFVARKMK